MKKYLLLAVLLFTVAFSGNRAFADTVNYTGGIQELLDSLNGTATIRNFTQTSPITLGANLPTVSTGNSIVTINGNNYSINGNSKEGFTLGAGQTLNINNVGSLDINGNVLTSINNFYKATANGGGVIYSNAGNVNVQTSVFSNNRALTNATSIGGAIRTTGAGFSLTVDDSTFAGNQSRWGGAIGNYSATGTATITNSTFVDNYASYGGAIYDLGNGGFITLNVSNSKFLRNSSLSYGGAIFSKNGSATIDNSDFIGNFSTGYYGGALYNFADTLTVTNSTFDGNHALDGGVIFNGSGTLVVNNSEFKNNYSTTYDAGAIDSGVGSVNTITNSSFTNNSAGENAGAVFVSTGKLTVKNSTFDNNRAINGRGGAIYALNEVVNIIGDNGITSFTGNTDSTGSNAIDAETSTVNINAGNGGQVIFNDKIFSNSINNAININKTGSDVAGDPPVGVVTDGTVQFNNTVSAATINVYNGKLSLASGNYIDGNNLNLYGGNLNLENSNATDVLTLNDFTSSSGATLSFDADLAGGINDKFICATASGSLQIQHMNILSDANISSLTLFTQSNSPTLSDFRAYTTDFEYYLTQSASSGIFDVRRIAVSGLNYAIEDSTNPRSFSATRDTDAEYNLLTMGGANSTLDINGNNYNINGLGYSGVTVLAGQTLNISNVGSLNSDFTVNKSWNGFRNLLDGGAVNNQGDLVVSNSVFYNNSTINGSGGVIYNTGTASISDSDFYNNSTVGGGNGGAIYNNSTADLNIDNSKFNNNTTNIYGGAIYSTGTGSVNISNSEFNANSSNTEGGAIYALSSSLNIENTKFTGNHAPSSAGAISSIGADTFTISNSEFNSNYSSSNSGAILNNSNLLAITGTIFTGNHTSGNGGAIQNAYSLSIADSAFTGNYAASGAGGAIFTTGSGNITISNTKFNSNHSNSVGGVIYKSGSGTLSISSGSEFISNNTASTPGGAIYNESGILNISDSKFVLNSSASAPGGAIYNESGILNISDSKFISNSSTWAPGGAIYSANSAFSITNSEFSGNYNNNVGGAIANDGGSFFTLTNTKFNNNYSSSSGGAVYSAGSGNLTITGSEFNSNYTTNGPGGAVYSSGSLMNIANTRFTGNHSISPGGAIYISGGPTATITNSEFNSNYSNNNGGAINSSASILNISNSIFTGNYSNNYGGGALCTRNITTITNSIFNDNHAYGDSYVLGGAIYFNGTLNLIADNGVTSFTGNTDQNGANAIYLAGGDLNLNAGNNGQITFNDGINSVDINNQININSSHVDGDTATPPSGAPVDGTVNFNNFVTNSTINLYNGTAVLGQDNYFNGNNVVLSGGAINLANGQIGATNFNNLTVNNSINMAIDANLNTGFADKITSANTATGLGMININQINMIGDSSQQITNLQIADANTKDYLQLGVTTYESPIYKYNMTYNRVGGTIGVVNAGITPSVLGSSVASTGGAYLNQTSAYSEAFGNMDSVMFLPQSERLLMKYNNKTASADSNFVFSPTLLPESDAGTWIKQYTTFENIPLNNGPNVSNVGYGMLVGRDSKLQDIGNGFTGYLSAYAGYNGSHQNYGNVGVYQNGGLVGLTGTTYKGNFFAALTASAGGSNGNNYNSFGVDNFTTIMAGLAAKTGYNFEFLRGKLILQPSYMMSYTFLNTFDYTAASGVNMTSDPINAIQISPGLKIIGNLKDGWQPYIGLNMVWNIMDSSKFYANDLQLPQLSVAPYVEYGLGVQRKWGDRFTGFGQAMARGGGRNGVALQFGFRWAIGKNNQQ